MSLLFVDLAIPVAVNKIFTYRVPDHLRALVKPGIRVLAPFAGRSVVGVVVGLSPRSEVPRIKEIAGVVDAEPVLSGELLRLASWISEYYLCPMGEVVKAMLVRGALSGGK